ncbi:histone-lysine N-methyltransferase, H3 lysine-79 specific-like [Centruroides sculpturatus]|uniref:histone-lysine N-methyltransferase, H3 lysine-79 specific-like n=1 Tax=Centruroides sculpturatus TaxID=218467 RepID=UPI000C6E4C3F|nr:histone-lysine N-methyltransferase, H3 lysine-79 specific-like [Centruroides sculpturatus]
MNFSSGEYFFVGSYIPYENYMDYFNFEHARQRPEYGPIAQWSEFGPFVYIDEYGRMVQMPGYGSPQVFYGYRPPFQQGAWYVRTEVPDYGPPIQTSEYDMAPEVTQYWQAPENYQYGSSTEEQRSEPPSNILENQSITEVLENEQCSSNVSYQHINVPENQMDNDNTEECSLYDINNINADDFDKNINAIPSDEPQTGRTITKVKCDEPDNNLEETELSSSDSDEDIEGFYFCMSDVEITPFKRRRRPLKRAFSYLQFHSLAGQTIQEEDELDESSEDDESIINSAINITPESLKLSEVEVLNEETNDKKKSIKENKELIQPKERENAAGSSPKGESVTDDADDDEEKTTKCFDVFVTFFRRISSVICFCCGKRK